MDNYQIFICKESLVIYLKGNVGCLIEECEKTLQNINTILVQFSKLQYLLRHVGFLIATTRNPLVILQACREFLQIAYILYRNITSVLTEIEVISGQIC